MASQTTVDSSEAVAYAVLEQIAEADGWCTTGFATGVIKWNKTRKEELPKNWTGLPPSPLKASEEILDEIRQTAEYGIDMLEEKEKLTGRLSGVDADGLLRFRAMRTVLSPEGMRKIREVCRVGPVSPERVMAVVFAPEMPTTRN